MGDPPRPGPPLAGSVLELLRAELPPRYQDLEPLASGGMGVLFKARDREAARPVAIKTIQPALLEASPGSRARFVREAQTLERLSHPGIVKVFEVGKGERLPYYVMELVEGETLGRVMARDERRDLGGVLAILIDVADALAHAHFRGVIHRDLKPDNILLLPGGGVKLVDFGLAKVLDLTRISHSGDVMGTPLYMAPEQREGAEAEARADLWSVGAILYELLTGAAPFPAGRMALGSREAPAAPSGIDPRVTPELDALVLSTLSLDPEARPASANAFKAGLSFCLGAYRGPGDAPLAGEAWEALLASDLERLAAEAGPPAPRLELAAGEMREVVLMRLRLGGLAAADAGGRPGTLAFVRERVLKVLAGEIERFGGMVEGCEGDLLRSWFGTRTSTGTDAEQAARAGLALQEKLAPLNAMLSRERLALSIGAAIDAATLAVDGNRAIDRTPFALERRVGPIPFGAVLLTPAARARVGSGLALGPEADGLVPVLGPAPGTRAPGSRPAELPAAPLVGRQAELDQLLAVHREALREPGPRPRLVALCGEAGMGRTRLVEELLARIDRSPPDPVAWAVASSYDRTPYLVLAALVRRILGLPDGLPPTEVSARLTVGLGSRPGAEALGLLLGVRRKPESTPSATRREIAEAVASVLDLLASRSRAGGRPGLVVISELQWLDPLSHEVLDELLTRIDGRLLLVLGHRPGFTLPERWRRRTEHRTLTLGPLEPAAARALVDATRAGRPMAKDAADRILAAAGGHPHFLVEATLHLLSPGPAQGAPVPPTVVALVRSRFDLLPRPERELLQVCAVLGDRVERALVEDVVERIWGRAHPLDEMLDRLVAARFLDRWEGTGTLAFREALTREAVASTLLASNRRMLHSVAAEVLETQSGPEAHARVVDLAYHYGRSDRVDKAYQYSMRALELAEEGHDAEGALRAAGEALGLLPAVGGTPADEFALLSRRARALELRGRVRELARDLARLEELAARLADPVRIAAVDNRLSWHAWWILEDTPRARRYALTALAAAEHLGDRAGQALAHRNLGSLVTMEGDFAAALAAHERAAALYLELGDRVGLAASHCSRGITLFGLGRVSAAFAALEEALALDRELSELRGVGRDLRHRGELFAGVGRLDQAEVAFTAALANDRKIGHRAGQALNLVQLGGLCLDLGRVPEARDRFAEALELAGEIEARATGIEARLGLARSLLADPGADPAKAREVATLAVLAAGRAGAPARLARAILVLARAALAAGDPVDARHWVGQGLELPAARALGPLPRAELLFDGFLVLSALGAPEAGPLLAGAETALAARTSLLDDPALGAALLDRPGLPRALRAASAR